MKLIKFKGIITDNIDGFLNIHLQDGSAEPVQSYYGMVSISATVGFIMTIDPRNITFIPSDGYENGLIPLQIGQKITLSAHANP